jgi:SAM-dependent methyltransferase
MTPSLRRLLFETLYRNRYLYRFASTVPFAGQWRTWQRLVLKRIQGTEVLELGCGLGDLLADMLEQGYACRAIEHSPEMVSAARDTLKRRNVGQKTTIVQGSAQYLPFEDASFDTVVSTFPSEYIYDPDTIAEVARVLRPGGRLVVIEGSSLLPVGFLQPLLVLIQVIVYGPSILRDSLQRRDPAENNKPQGNRTLGGFRIPGFSPKTNAEPTTTVIPDADFGRFIPLERFGLQRRSELVRSERWEVYITIGEKA